MEFRSIATIFNIKGNNYRLITVIDFGRAAIPRG